MTEKQFIQKGYSIINTQTDELVNASSDESAEIITDWLNDLSNKYAEVKKENYGNLDGINYYQEENGHLSERISDLECENKQLKQAYTQLKHRHSLLHDVCIDAECDRDNYRKDIESLENENEQLKQESQSWRKTAYHMDTIAHEDRDYAKRMHKENEQLKQDRRRLIGYLWKYTNLDEEEIQEDIFNRELLDEYCPNDLEFKSDE